MLPAQHHLLLSTFISGHVQDIAQLCASGIVLCGQKGTPQTLPRTTPWLQKIKKMHVCIERYARLGGLERAVFRVQRRFVRRVAQWSHKSAEEERRGEERGTWKQPAACKITLGGLGWALVDDMEAAETRTRPISAALIGSPGKKEPAAAAPAEWLRSPWRFTALTQNRLHFW